MVPVLHAEEAPRALCIVVPRRLVALLVIIERGSLVVCGVPSLRVPPAAIGAVTLRALPTLLGPDAVVDHGRGSSSDRSDGRVWLGSCLRPSASSAAVVSSRRGYGVHREGNHGQRTRAPDERRANWQLNDETLTHPPDRLAIRAVHPLGLPSPNGRSRECGLREFRRGMLLLLLR